MGGETEAHRESKGDNYGRRDRGTQRGEKDKLNKPIGSQKPNV